MKYTILQNKHRNLAGLMIASVLALAACGGGGGGDHGGGGGLASGTFTRTFNAAPTAGIVVPFYNTAWGDVTAQFLYTAAEVGAAGKIVTLRFYRDSAPAGETTCPNTTIRLGHTSLAALTGTYAADINGGTPVIVFNNATLTIPSGAAGSSFDVPLTTSFDYNGTNNLVVQVDRTTTCSGQVTTRIRDTVASRLATSFAVDATAGTADNNTTTGALFPYTAWMQFVFAGGDNNLDYGGVTTNTWPFDDNGAPGLRIQSLYLASEINGSGPITGIAYQANATTVAGTYSYSLRFGHSTLSALTVDYAGNYSGSPTTVANAVVNFTIPAGVPAGEWIWIPIPDGVFTYNGTDNLIVDVSTTAGISGNAYRVTSIAGRRAPNNGATSTTAVLVDGNLNHIALRFNGGPVAVLSIGTDNAETFPFGTPAMGSSKRQHLYLAPELGTGGSITSVACRLDDGFVGTTVATSYPNFQVVLGHTTSNTLSTTFATNMTDAATAFSGTYGLAAGLRAGDWIDIPLSTPFAYDGTRNLVVQMSSDSGANTYSCDLKLDATLYLSRRVGINNRNAVTGILGDFQSPLKLTISK